MKIWEFAIMTGIWLIILGAVLGFTATKDMNEYFETGYAPTDASQAYQRYVYTDYAQKTVGAGVIIAGFAILAISLLWWVTREEE